MLIGICGPKGAGKSEVAWILHRDHNYIRLPFAAVLKNMLRTFGLTDKQVFGSEKEVPLDWLDGVTPRHLMQTLGTEWGRNLVLSDIWVRAWEKAVVGFGTDVVVEDVRFPNEVDALRRHDGVLWRIERPGLEHSVAHESEAHVLVEDATLGNYGDLEALKCGVEAMVNGA